MSEQGMALERASDVGRRGRGWLVRGRWTVLIGIAVVAALGAAPSTKLGVLDAGSDAGPSSAGDAVAGDGVSAATPQQEFTSLSTKGKNATFHAVYQVLTKAGDVTDRTLETWRSGGRERVEFVVSGKRSSYFTVNGKVSHCVQESGAWTCTQRPIGTPNFTGEVAKAGDVLSAINGTWNGSATRCFTFKASSPTQQMCFLSKGVLVKVVFDSSRVEATSVEDAVSDGDFSLPASPK